LRFTPILYSVCEGAMVEALIGLFIAAALAVYLVATLLRPEKF
jgi:K+-transporting ATPase KdpF subunit